MITMAIGLGRDLLMDGMVQTGVLVLRYAIICRGLGALRGNNQAHALLPRDTALTIAVLIPAAWHIGGLAGYGDDATRSFKRRCSALRSHSKSR